jgi:glycosyl transferase, family 25
MQKIPVYVISLARAPERRRAIAEHLASIGIEYEIVEAVDGRSLSPEYLKSVTAPGVKLTPGMVGCNLSHLEVTKRQLAGKADVALFLEDDARLSPRTRDFLVRGVDASAFDICFLDCADFNVHGPVFYDRDDQFDLAGGFRAHRLSGGPQRTHAMLVTRAASESRIDHFLPIRNAIDVYSWQPSSLRFHAIIAPKAAWLSEHSIESFTSPSGRSGATREALFGIIDKGPLYYAVSDWVTLARPRRLLLAQILKSEQVLAPKRRWAPMPPSGKVMH